MAKTKFRILKKGEKVKKGDEFGGKWSWGQGWWLTSCPGLIIGGFGTEGMTYRRRVPTKKVKCKRSKK